MTENFLKLQKQFKRKLPVQIKTVWKDYLDFCQTPLPEDAKSFSAYQQACKNALSHLLTLLKLMSFHLGKDMSQDKESDWIQAARNAVAELEDVEDEC